MWFWECSVQVLLSGHVRVGKEFWETMNFLDCLEGVTIEITR